MTTPATGQREPAPAGALVPVSPPRTPSFVRRQLDATGVIAAPLMSPQLRRQVDAMPREDAEVVLWHTNRLSQLMQEGARIASAYELYPLHTLFTGGQRDPSVGGVGPKVGAAVELYPDAQTNGAHHQNPVFDRREAPVPAPNTKRLLLLSANAVGLPKSSLDEVLRAVVKPDVLCVTFDDYEGSLATLVNAARESIRGFQADSIGVLTPCSPGLIELYGGISTTEQVLMEDPDVRQFWRILGGLLRPGGRIDVLGAYAAARQEGRALIKALSLEAGVIVAASAENTNQDGFMLDIGSLRLNAGACYFTDEQLASWRQAAMGAEPQPAALPPQQPPLQQRPSHDQPPPPQSKPDALQQHEPSRPPPLLAPQYPRMPPSPYKQPQGPQLQGTTYAPAKDLTRLVPQRTPPGAGAPASPPAEDLHPQPLKRMSRRSFIITVLIVILVVGAILAAVGYVLQFQSLDVLSSNRKRALRLGRRRGLLGAGSLEGRRGLPIQERQR